MELHLLREFEECTHGACSQIAEAEVLGEKKLAEGESEAGEKINLPSRSIAVRERFPRTVVAILEVRVRMKMVRATKDGDVPAAAEVH